jgi:ABC-type sugar transport system permease subunit
LLVFLGIMLVATLNAPTKGGPKVMETMQTYLAEVKRTAIPFLIGVALLAAAMGIMAARTVYMVWPNQKKRTTLFTGVFILSPLSHHYGYFHNRRHLFCSSIFPSPSMTSLQNRFGSGWAIIKKLSWVSRFNPKDFVQALYNVVWYSLIVVPAQTALAIGLAVLLNSNIKMRNFFRTIFYAPSVSSSVVITLIFVWLYLKGGFLNGFLTSVLTPLGINFDPINWLGDPRGLFQLFGFEIDSAHWYLRGPSIAWMSIMFQNIFTTAPTF